MLYNNYFSLALAQAYEVYGVRPVKRNNIQNVTFYVMSSNDDAGLEAGQYWTTMDKFPTYKVMELYAHSDGSASTSRPSLSEEVSSSFLYDPTNPVPTVGGGFILTIYRYRYNYQAPLRRAG